MNFDNLLEVAAMSAVKPMITYKSLRFSFWISNPLVA